MRPGVILLAVLLWPSGLLGAVVNIPADQPTVQAGIDASTDGDTVLVAPGTYTENLDFTGRAIVVVSEEGRDVTFIEPLDASSPIVKFAGGEDTLSVLDGFGLRNATGSCGVLMLGSSPIVQNCEISFCGGGAHLGGICSSDSWGKIRDNIIHDSYHGILAAGMNYRSLEITGNNISHNPGHAIAYFDYYNPLGNALISRNILADNEGSGIMFGWDGANGCNILDNTIVRNDGDGVYSMWGLGNAVYGNIVAENGGQALDLFGAYVDYNNLWGNGSGNGVVGNGISADPLLLDPDNGDYRLSELSPCRDAGRLEEQYNDPDGTRSDIGALSYQSTPLPIGDALAFDGNGRGAQVANLIPVISWEFVAQTATTQTAYEIEVGIDIEWTAAELWQTGTAYSANEAVTYGGLPLSDRTTYFVRLRVYDGVDWGGWRESYFTTHLDYTIEVPYERSTIQSAIFAAVSGDSIMVAPGAYSENLDLLGKEVKIIATGGPSVTTLRPADPGTLLVSITSGEGSGARLEGFTVECDNSGNVVSVDNESSCEIVGNVFTGYAGSGHIIYCHAKAVEIGGNLFVDNPLQSGSSSSWPGYCIEFAYKHQYGLVENNTFYDCAGAAGGDGLGVQFHRNIVAQCSGTALFFDRWSVIDNCFWGNRNDLAYISDGPATTSTVGSFESDPLFVDADNGDFSLLPESPCIDAGIGSPPVVDADGSPRDLGAYPYEATNYPVAVAINYGTGSHNDVAGTLTPTFYWGCFSPVDISQTGVQIQIGENNNWTVAEVWDSGPASSPDTSMVYAGPALQSSWRYFMRIRVQGGSGWGDWRYDSFVTDERAVCHIPSNYSTLAEAFELDEPWNAVLFAPGTYSGEGFTNLYLPAAPPVLNSESGAEATVFELDGGSLFRFPYLFENPTVWLNGLTIRGGDTAFSVPEQGGVIAKHCIFEQNTVGITATTMWTGGTIDSCIFRENGVGINLSDESYWHVERSLFIGNTRGMQLDNAMNASIKNNVFAHNQYAIDGNGNTSIDFTKNAVHYNLTGIYGIGLLSTPSSFTCNDVWGNTFGGFSIVGQYGNISDDPRFCDTTLQTGTTVASNSPLLPEFNGCSELIGDVTIGCPCCVGHTGDANNSGGDEPTLGDISTLIDATFITGSCVGVVNCYAEADVNQSGGPYPDCDGLTLGDISILIDYLFISGPYDPVTNPEGITLPACL